MKLYSDFAYVAENTGLCNDLECGDSRSAQRTCGRCEG